MVVALLEWILPYIFTNSGVGWEWGRGVDSTWLLSLLSLVLD